MVQFSKLNEGPAAWDDDLYQLEDGVPPTGGAPDLPNDVGLLNEQARNLGARSRYLREAVAAYTALEGATVEPGRVVWSSDGQLLQNATGAGIAITGRDAATLLADGLVDFFETFQAETITMSTPPAAVMPFAIVTPPDGWLECDGSSVSRSSYADLFAVLGSYFGAGDGATTFGLPDLRGEFIRGWDNGKGSDPARAFGSLQFDNLRSHDHFAKNIAGTDGSPDTGLTVGEATASGNGNEAARTTSTGGSETRPRNVALMFCIKY